MESKADPTYQPILPFQPGDNQLGSPRPKSMCDQLLQAHTCPKLPIVARCRPLVLPSSQQQEGWASLCFTNLPLFAIKQRRSECTHNPLNHLAALHATVQKHMQTYVQYAGDHLIGNLELNTIILSLPTT